MKQPANEISLEKNLIFKKYKLLQNIGCGAFGTIFLGINIKTNEKVAVKIEERKVPRPSLEKEAYILFSLKGPGLPELKTFGRTQKYNILIEGLLGKSLYQLYNECDKNISTKDICMIAIQLIDRIEFVHNKNFIHRDIKPHNILLGLNDPSCLYLIDFGLAKKYRSERGNHVKFSITKQLIGTPRFCSINAMRGFEQSRRDDLESISYLILYFFKGYLPWQGLRILNKEEKFQRICEIKKATRLEDICIDLPKEIYNFCLYVRKLEFEENPDYGYMRDLFNKILKNMGFENDRIFSWIQEKNRQIILNMPKHNTKSRISPHKRLLDKIRNSLEKKRRENLEKINENNINNNNKNVIIKNNVSVNFIQLTKENENEKNNENEKFDNKDISLNTVFFENKNMQNTKINLLKSYEESSKEKIFKAKKNNFLNSNFDGFEKNLKEEFCPVNMLNSYAFSQYDRNNKSLNKNVFNSSINPKTIIREFSSLEKMSETEPLKNRISLTKDGILNSASNDEGFSNLKNLKCYNNFGQDKMKKNNERKNFSEEKTNDNINSNENINMKNILSDVDINNICVNSTKNNNNNDKLNCMMNRNNYRKRNNNDFEKPKKNNITSVKIINNNTEMRKKINTNNNLNNIANKIININRNNIYDKQSIKEINKAVETARNNKKIKNNYIHPFSPAIRKELSYIDTYRNNIARKTFSKAFIDNNNKNIYYSNYVNLDIKKNNTITSDFVSKNRLNRNTYNKKYKKAAFNVFHQKLNDQTNIIDMKNNDIMGKTNEQNFNKLYNTETGNFMNNNLIQKNKIVSRQKIIENKRYISKLSHKNEISRNEKMICSLDICTNLLH